MKSEDGELEIRNGLGNPSAGWDAASAGWALSHVPRHPFNVPRSPGVLRSASPLLRSTPRTTLNHHSSAPLATPSISIAQIQTCRSGSTIRYPPPCGVGSPYLLSFLIMSYDVADSLDRRVHQNRKDSSIFRRSSTSVRS